MTRRLERTGQFKRDLKKAQKRGKNLEKLWSIVERLLANDPLDPRQRPHRLSGDLAGFRECHIEPDWLLIWSEDEDELILVRIGTHADLFE